MGDGILFYAFIQSVCRWHVRIAGRVVCGGCVSGFLSLYSDLLKCVTNLIYAFITSELSLSFTVLALKTLFSTRDELA